MDIEEYERAAAVFGFVRVPGDDGPGELVQSFDEGMCWNVRWTRTGFFCACVQHSIVCTEPEFSRWKSDKNQDIATGRSASHCSAMARVVRRGTRWCRKRKGDKGAGKEKKTPIHGLAMARVLRRGARMQEKKKQCGRAAGASSTHAVQYQWNPYIACS